MTAPSNAETFLTRLIDARVEASLDARGIGKHRCVPTEASYDAAVAALNKHRERADVLADLVDVVALQTERMPLDMPPDAYQHMLVSIGSRLRAAQMRDQMARQSLPVVAMEMLREERERAAEAPFETIEMRAENGVFTRVEVLGENVAATGNGMAVLSPWAAEVVGNGYLHAARTALANAGNPPRPADGCCSHCGGLEGNHIFRDCPGRNS